MWENLDNILAFLGVSVIIKLVSSYVNSGKRPSSAKYVGKVTDLAIFPIKSLGGIRLKEAKATQKGLEYPDEPLFDRSFMIIDADGVFKTGRTIPKLTTIKPSIVGHHLVLECTGMEPLKLPKVALRDSSKKLFKTEVFGQAVEGQDCGNIAAEWISRCVNHPNLRIVYNMDGILQRELTKQSIRKQWNQHAKEGDRTVFHDAYPYLLCTETSLYDLNDRLENRVPMTRFRPNITMDGCPPFDEDHWDELWIGDVKFTNIKPCDRCTLTTVDPYTGTIDKNEEPLKTLKSYRLNPPDFKHSPLFGIHLVLDSENGKMIKVGDEIHVMYKA